MKYLFKVLKIEVAQLLAKIGIYPKDADATIKQLAMTKEEIPIFLNGYFAGKEVVEFGKMRAKTRKKIEEFYKREI